MIVHVILGLFSLVWGVLGLLFAIAPAPILAWTRQTLLDAWWRFWVAQAALLVGLLLIIGTSHLEGRWLWVACGVVGVVKACFVLGSSESLRDRVWQHVNHWPVWLLRCNGVLGLVLAVLLAADIMLHG